MKEFYKKILNNSFAKNIVIISGASIISQFLNFVFSPIITRVFLPTDYGAMSMFVSVVTILSTPASLKYEMALPLERDDNKAKNLFILCIAILLLYTNILSILVLIFQKRIFNIINASSLYNYRKLLIAGIFLYGLREIYIQFFFRGKEFKYVSKHKIIQTSFGNISKVVFGFMKVGSLGLIIGQILKDCLTVIPFTFKVLNNKNSFNKISFKTMKYNLLKYKDYPLFQAPSSFLSIYKNQLPVFSLAIYGNSIVGFYSLANTVVKIPVTLLGYSVRNVFFAEAASIGKENPLQLKQLSNAVFKKMVLIGLLPCIILLLFGPSLFSIVFGEQWIKAGEYSRILAVSVYADFIFSPVNRVYEILERQNIRLLLDILGLILVLTAFYIAQSLSNSAEFAILLYSISMTLYCYLIYFISQRLLNSEIKK